MIYCDMCDMRFMKMVYYYYYYHYYDIILQWLHMVLSRRRILNDLSSDVPGVPKIEEEPAGSDESEGTQSIIVSGQTAIQNLPTGLLLTRSLQDSETSIDFVQGPPGSMTAWVNTINFFYICHYF